MEKKLGFDLQMETPEGGLKELVLRWFTETQAPLLHSNGNFPEWFQGFAARKDAEDLLRDKALGCFLIRLSDKAVGYILSYKGHDRCRHFVITQNQDGHFVIAGDCQTYHSLTELIEHFKVSPIQPFGECLTSSCYEENTGELYDVVSYNNKGKSGVSVQALRTLWDQKNDHVCDPASNQRIQQQNDSPPVQPPALPLKNKTQNRKLMGTVSVDNTSLSQGVPPVPKRGIPAGFFLSGSLPETTTHPNETQTYSNTSERVTGNTNFPLRSDRDSLSVIDIPGLSNCELTQVESRSKSLPQLDNDSMVVVDEEYSNQLPSFTTSTSHSPSLPKRVTCQTYSLHNPKAQSLSSSSLEQQSDDVEMLRSNPLYQSSEESGGSSAQQVDSMYAEVPQSSPPAGLSENTYEQIPGEAAATVQGNTYESLDDMKIKKSKSTWGKSNIKWKKFLPDYKKK
ncbi:hypothetical protein Q5P01_006310 [Channa striata]|uniref:SH2 domain-containing protein n=1 Tax=Channa striata TaxID=64152 RepID=A0AA88NB70_CHASR|nr:hypothetical protein Q5P01_006310 [Channa striata]